MNGIVVHTKFYGVDRMIAGRDRKATIDLALLPLDREIASRVRKSLRGVVENTLPHRELLHCECYSSDGAISSSGANLYITVWMAVIA